MGMQAAPRAREPATATELKLAIRSAFSVAFTEGELDNYLSQLLDSNLASTARDEFDQILFGLTPKGTLAAQRLIKIT